MAGYAPLFSTLTTGTLCGRWPDIGLWPIVLSLSDRQGVVDVTPDYLSRVTGLQLEAVVACMQRFCEPDPYSRSSAEDGRRLTLLEPEQRDWGWQVVNHGLYRERARKQYHNEKAVTSGANKERLKTRRDQTRPARPATTGETTLSEAEAEAKTEAEAEKRKKKTPPSLRSGSPRLKSNTVPDDFTLSPEIQSWSTTENPELDVPAEFAKFRDHEFREPHSDWLRCWRRWVREGKRRGDFARIQKAGSAMVFAGKPVEWR